MIITTNIDAMKTLRSLDGNNRKNSKSLEKLSSGLKINRAADDSAGLAISTKMRAQIRGLAQDERNIEDAISMFNVAEGGMEQIENMIHRIRELAVQSASDTNTDEDRQVLQKEVDQLIEGIDRIAHDTEFNTHKVLLGRDETITTTTTKTTNISIFKASTAYSSAAVVNELHNIGNKWTSACNSMSTLRIVDNAGGSTTYTASFGLDSFINNNYPGFDTFLKNFDETDPAQAQYFVDTVAAAMTASVNNTPALSSLNIAITGLLTKDGHFAFQVGNGTQYSLLFGSCSNQGLPNSIAHTFLHNTFGGAASTATSTSTSTSTHQISASDKYIIQVGPNTDQNITFEIPSMVPDTIGKPPTEVIENADVSTQSKANATITLCDIALDYVSNGRSSMGSHVNRLESAKSNTTNYHENISTAESRLRDTNMSKEMVEQVKENILMQSATAMLAQANQKPEGILQLLR